MRDMFQHVVPRKDGWAVIREGAQRASRVFPTRVEAKNYAQRLAQKHHGCAIMHGDDAKIFEYKCKKPEYHVVRRAGKWAVLGGDIEEHFEMKGAAMKYAHERALEENTCMVVHDLHGKFESRNCGLPHHHSVGDVLRMQLRV